MTHTENNELTTGPGAPYVPGELVDITIRGARVGFERDLVTGWIKLDVDPDWELLVDTRRTTVTRVAPPEWPPQPADVWTDRNRNTWMALQKASLAGVAMRPASDNMADWSNVDELLAEVGPMRLEYRPGWTRQPDPDPARPTEVDERAETIAGLYALAALLAERPDLTFNPYNLLVGDDTMETVSQWADVLGAKLQTLASSDGLHWNAEGMVRGLRIRAYWIDHTAAEPVAAQPDEATVAAALDDPAPTVQVVIADGSNGPAGLIAVAPIDDPADEPDDRCTGSYADGAAHTHNCELYGTHPGVKHICICAQEWTNVAVTAEDGAAQAWAENELDHDRNPTAAGYAEHLAQQANAVPAPRDSSE